MPQPGKYDLLPLSRSRTPMRHHQVSPIYCHRTDLKFQSATTRQGWSTKNCRFSKEKEADASWWRNTHVENKIDACHEIGVIKGWFSVPIALSGALVRLSLSKPCQMARLFLNKSRQPFVLLKNGETVRDKTAPTLSSDHRWSVIWDLCLRCYCSPPDSMNASIYSIATIVM